MSRKSNTVNSFADLMNLQAIQEITCYNEAEKKKAELASVPVTNISTKEAEIEALWAARQRPRRAVSKAEREWTRSLYGLKRR